MQMKTDNLAESSVYSVYKTVEDVVVRQDAMFQMLTRGQGLVNPFMDISVSRDNIVQVDI